MVKFGKGAIAIQAGLNSIKEVLVEYRYIAEWEKGFDSFKELHVSNKMRRIVHWHIADDIDYVFTWVERTAEIDLELTVVGPSVFWDEEYNLLKTQYYIDTVLARIKSICERLDVSVKSFDLVP